MPKQPGVILYFDLIPVLKNLKTNEQANLFQAILEYGQNQNEITLLENVQLLWPLVRQRLDFDAQRYQQTVSRRAYAAYVRWSRRQGTEPLPFAQWQTSKGGILPDDDPAADYPDI